MLEIRLNGDSFPFGIKEMMNWGVLRAYVLSIFFGVRLEEIMIALEHLKFKALQKQYILQCSVMGNPIDDERLGILERKRQEE